MDRLTIFERLRADHAGVLAELDAIEALLDEARAAATATGTAGPEPLRLPLRALERLSGFAVHLEAQFATHLAAEDEVLYPALTARLDNGRELTAPLHAEHRELRAMLATLLLTLARPASAARDEQLAVQARDLVDLLRIHIRKEEALLFGVAERLLPPCDLTELEARREPSGAPANGSSHPKKGSV